LTQSIDRRAVTEYKPTHVGRERTKYGKTLYAVLSQFCPTFNTVRAIEYFFAKVCMASKARSPWGAGHRNAWRQGTRAQLFNGVRASTPENGADQTNRVRFSRSNIRCYRTTASAPASPTQNALFKRPASSPWRSAALLPLSS
jgi:hypothetical protein